MASAAIVRQTSASESPMGRGGVHRGSITSAWGTDRQTRGSPRSVRMPVHVEEVTSPHFADGVSECGAMKPNTRQTSNGADDIRRGGDGHAAGRFAGVNGVAQIFQGRIPEGGETIGGWIYDAFVGNRLPRQERS